MKSDSSLLPVLNIGKLHFYQGNTDKQQTFFSPGQLLKGKIIGKENNQLILDINGKQFKTNHNASLPAGEKLNLQVIATTPQQISLRVITDSLIQNVSSSLHLLATGSGSGSALASLSSRVSKDGLSKATLQTLAFFSSLLATSAQLTVRQQTDNYGLLSASQHRFSLQGQELKQLLNRSGLNLEQFLAAGQKEYTVRNIKSALLDIIQIGHDPKTVQQAQQLLSTIDLFQLLQIRFAAESVFFQPLPLPFVKEGYLLVEPEDRKEESKADKKIKKYSLHLNLEGLGNIEIELKQQENGIHIRFFAEDQERTEFLAQNRDDLHKKLTNIQVGSVQFLTGAENPTGTLVKMLTAKSSGIINTVV